MISDIYMRDSSDPAFFEDVLDISDELEILLGQIRMILFTKPGEVVSDINFGIDLESYVFSMNTSNEHIEKLVGEKIYQNCPLAAKFDVKISSKFFYGSTRDICLIDIFVDGSKYLGFVLK
jgi:hypothetical protein